MIKKVHVTLGLLLLTFPVFAQKFDMRNVEYNNIKGAYKLGQPKLILNDKGEMLCVEKAGLAGPLMFDWDGDGKKDLLVGEFGRGKSANLMVFKNVGKRKSPIFASEGYYAKDVKGDKLYIHGS